jgi:hypothetical protein
VVAPRVSRENLGAWLFKCNPKLTSLPDLQEHGVETWCVQENYRSALFEPGQPALLWVSGSARATPIPGIWALGEITGPALSAQKYVVPLTLEFLSSPLPRADLVGHPELADLEVLQQPQMSNPSFLTPNQYAYLRQLL